MAPVNVTNETSVAVNPATVLLITTIDALIFVVSITGNSLVIAVVVKNVRMRTTMNLFVVNMAASDILTTIIPFPLLIATLLVGQWPFHKESIAGLVLCKMSSTTCILSSGVSVASLVAIALDRFWAVFFPTKRPPSTKRPFVTLTVIWLICISFAFPFVIITTVIESTAFCWVEVNDFHITLLFLLSILQVSLPTIAILVLYPAILIRLWKRKLPGNPSSANQEIRDRTNRKVTCMAVTLMLAFVVSSFPNLGILIKYFIERKINNDLILHGIATTFMCSACALNPLICIIFNTNFRKGFKQILQMFCCCNSIVVKNCFKKNQIGNFSATVRDQAIELADVKVIGISKL